MAPVELESSPSFTHTFVRGTDLLLAVGLSAVAGNTIYRSYFAAPPSSAARERQYRRFGHVKLFVTLASLSLLTATYYGGSVAWLSYRIWADERGIELPTSLFGDKGALRGGEHPGRFQLVRWLDETPLYQDAYEFVAEKARYFWWSQQLNLASISWTTFLAIEGRRRNIPNLLAFQLLGQVVSLSYAQNLFFVAMLLTPVPLPKSSKESIQPSSPTIPSKFSQIKAKIIPTKPDGWLPHPAFYIAFLLASMTTTFLIPYASNTPSFLTIIHLSQFLPRGMLLLPYVLPQRLGTVPEGPHSAHKTYLTLFRIISTISALLHLKSTTMALFLNTPESHYYRYTLMHPFKSEYRSTLDRSSTAVARLFGAISEHPVVSAVGWDVLLSGLTLGLWTSIRNLDPSALLSASIPFTEQITSKAAAEGMRIEPESDHGEEESEIVVHTSRKPALLKRGRGRPKKTESVEPTDDLVSQSPAKSKNKDALDPDATYRPADGGKYATEGDEEAREEDWEAAALAWGLVTANLGVGSSAVYGAECVSR